MTNAYFATAVVLLVCLFLILLRALKGPTRFDRILAVNAMGTKTVILLAILGKLGGRSGFVDIAILYGLINYIATVAILKFVQMNRLGS